MTAYELLTKDKIEEAQLHFKRGMEILDEVVDPAVCEEIDKYMALPYTINIEKRGTLWAARAVEFNLEVSGQTEEIVRKHIE